uniref:Uncharacterized protein n=1 Tax=Aegilops tauschii subsp. strangulata TaxID=200361 RepID=A0A453L842_AEGTS
MHLLVLCSGKLSKIHHHCKIRKSSRRRLNLPMHAEQSPPQRKGQSLHCPQKLRSCS